MDAFSCLIGRKINGYTVIRFLGSGSFGNVYEVVQKSKHFAIKIPNIDKKKIVKVI